MEEMHREKYQELKLKHDALFDKWINSILERQRDKKRHGDFTIVFCAVYFVSIVTTFTHLKHLLAVLYLYFFG